VSINNNYMTSPVIQSIKTLKDCDNIDYNFTSCHSKILSDNNKFTSADNRSINMSFERKLYSSRRKKLLNFNGFNTFLNVLMKNKEKSEKHEIECKNVIFLKWKVYTKKAKK